MIITTGEAIEILEHLAKIISSGDYQETFKIAASALRPITREQVEKVWRGECDCSRSKACCTCRSTHCHDCIRKSEYRQATFCMKCGRPLDAEAVDMVMERLEALYVKDM